MSIAPKTQTLKSVNTARIRPLWVIDRYYSVCYNIGMTKKEAEKRGWKITKSEDYKVTKINGELNIHGRFFAIKISTDARLSGFFLRTVLRQIAEMEVTNDY